MTRALVVPGLDAILQSDRIALWLNEPDVIHALADASKILTGLTGTDQDLVGVLMSRRPMWAERFGIGLCTLCAVQVGILRTAEKYISWDVLVGCSNGDAARSVFANSISFEDMLQISLYVAKAQEICPPGSTAVFRRADTGALDDLDLKLCHEAGVAVSRWSPANATVAGTDDAIERLRSLIEHGPYKLNVLYPVPLHSPVLKPLQPGLRDLMRGLENPDKKLFSSVTHDLVTTSTAMREEQLTAIVQPIDWPTTLHVLREKFAVDTVINAGPGSDLMAMSQSSVTGIKFLDLLDLLD